MLLRNDIIKKCENRYNIAYHKFHESKTTVDDIRRYRNAMQRILNIMNKEQIKSNVYYETLKEFQWAIANG